MLFHKHIPSFPLSQYVDCIIYVEGNNKGTGFPKTAMSLVFNLNDSFKLYADKDFSSYIDYKKHWFTGLQTKPTYVESYGESKMVVVQFKTTGVCAFLRQPLHNFTNDYIPLDCVFDTYADEVWEQLCEAETINEKLLVTENFLLRSLLTARMPNERMLNSIDSKLKRRENTPVAEICRYHNISRKHLNFLCKEYLGVSPKMMSSLNRLQNILQQISRSRPESLTGFAYELDYFDQAHFNNSFKQFTGLKPTEYIKNVAIKPSLKIIPHFLPAD
ncbi:MAG: helix-turn-helix domain-containing protein [Bacteroidota bacterium]